MGVHAVAHAIGESARRHQGARWMRQQRAHWAVESRMLTHNAWHLAMFDLDDGNVESAVTILDHTLLPAADRWPLDACDAVALLLRIGRAGVDVATRWARLSTAFERQWQGGFWPFVDLHAALAHWSACRDEPAQRLLDSVALCARAHDFTGRRAAAVTLPGLRALGTWLRGAPRASNERLAALGRALSRAGGSRLQLETFRLPPALGLAGSLRRAQTEHAG
jgi:hypothetical protein